MSTRKLAHCGNAARFNTTALWCKSALSDGVNGAAKMTKQLVAVFGLLAAITGCDRIQPLIDQVTEAAATQGSTPEPAAPEEAAADAAFVDETKPVTINGAPIKDERVIEIFFEAYKAKNALLQLALYAENVTAAMYPAVVFGEGKSSISPAVRSDFANRPFAYAEMPKRFRIAEDKWVAFGESIDGEMRAPLMMVFDLNDAGLRIERSFTHIATPDFIEGPSVAAPTEAMTTGFQSLFKALGEKDFAVANGHFASGVSLFAYPPSNIDAFDATAMGAGDVSGVLAAKWGEGAWREDAFVSQYMQYVFIAVPPSDEDDEGFDRVALFTFGADAEAEDYEKIVRVDVMGPSGG